MIRDSFTHSFSTYWVPKSQVHGLMGTQKVYDGDGDDEKELSDSKLGQKKLKLNNDEVTVE